MPHRPEGQGAAPGGGQNLSIYTPPRVAGSTAATIMRQNSHQAAVGLKHSSMLFAGNAHMSGVVTPLVSSKPWVASQSEGIRGALMPSLEAHKSMDSTDRSTGTAGTKQYDEDRSVATLATESEDREATASALLMVARAAEREQMHAAAIEALSSAAPAVSSTVPLKKRKKTTDILRRQQGETTETRKDDDVRDSLDPCHVSPVSHSSEELHVDSRTVSKEDGTPPRCLSTNNDMVNRTSSYDSKDPSYSFRGGKQESSTQELLDSSKVHSTAQIAPPAHVLIPHFPTVLHQVLSDKEFDGKVVQWLPDGESWKVLRWDGFRRQVLPRYFADLRDEDGSGCGTIDAFLFHLGAWGFEEIKDGTDVGAYRHDLFIRGAQKLCVKMRFASDLTTTETKRPKTVSPNRSRQGDSERSMLQVPSLASMETDSSKPHQPNKRQRYETQSPSSGPLQWPYSDSAMWGAGPPFAGPESHHLYGMRAAAAMVGQYANPSQYDPRLQLRRPGTPPEILRQTSQYSPPQVRSGRGAMRIAANRAASPIATPIARQGFPVSNRGKGPRKTGACRPSLPSASSPAAESAPREMSPKNLPVDLNEAQRIGSAVQGVAFAISRKTKRKLPMTSTKKADAASASSANGSASVKGPKSEVAESN